MWILLKDGSLEITAQARGKKSDLVVRGRGPIERLFPDVETSHATDMHFYELAILDRDRVSDAIAKELRSMAYTSFEPDPSDLDPNAGARSSVGTPMPHGNFQVSLDGTPGFDRSGRTLFLTLPSEYGSITVSMTHQQAGTLLEQLGVLLQQS